MPRGIAKGNCINWWQRTAFPQDQFGAVFQDPPRERRWMSAQVNFSQLPSLTAKDVYPKHRLELLIVRRNQIQVAADRKSTRLNSSHS